MTPFESLPPSRASTRIWRAGDIEFDESRRQLKLGGAPIELEARPRELFLLLLAHAGEVVTKEEILETVWPGRIVTDASLTKCVARLRQVLGDVDHALIVTAHGYGYRLVADVRVETRTEAAHRPEVNTAPQAGDRIAGRPNWKLVKRLDTGGYGDVWLGEHDKTHERRVFKFALMGDQIASLKREITLFRLLSAGLGGRRDIGRLLDWNLDTLPYFIEVEWSPQGNLADWASQAISAGSLPLPGRLELAAQIAEALAGAHSLGVLHKDLKPSNVLIDLDEAGAPHIKLCDFGSGAALDIDRLEAMGITRMGLSQVLDSNSPTAGTPLYLRPNSWPVACPACARMCTRSASCSISSSSEISGDLWRPAGNRMSAMNCCARTSPGPRRAIQIGDSLTPLSSRHNCAHWKRGEPPARGSAWSKPRRSPRSGHSNGRRRDAAFGAHWRSRW